MHQDEETARIARDPRYTELLRRRGRVTWTLAAVMLGAYFGFILLVAFDPSLLARPIVAGGVTSLGIVVGFAVIVLAIGLTAIYVARANTVFDAMVSDLARADRA